MRDCCVAHLVRKSNGLDAFRRYLQSYRQYPAGVDHDHVVIFKGFAGRWDIGEYESELRGTTYRPYFVDDTGFDVGTYAKVWKHFDYRYYCFINSYSEVLQEDWLLYLREAISSPSVGAVGASGSCGSIASYNQFQAGVPSAYDGYITDDPFPPPKAPPESKLSRTVARFRRPVGRLKRAILRAAGLRRTPIAAPTSILDLFDPFPACHLRSNAFLVGRDVIRSYPTFPIMDKSDAFQFESGKVSLTNHVYRLGLEALVVGRDRRAYPKDRWHASNTFWQSDQSNLLVSDNQTRKYDDADDRVRRFYAAFAWRELANPVLLEAERASNC